MDKNAQQCITMKTLRKKRKKEKASKDKLREQHAKHNKKRRTPQKQRKKKRKNKRIERSKKKMVEDNASMKETEKTQRNIDLIDILTMRILNTGAINTSIPKPISKAKKRNIVNKFVAGFGQNQQRCQACGIQKYNCKMHRVKIMHCEKLNSVIRPYMIEKDLKNPCRHVLNIENIGNFALCTALTTSLNFFSKLGNQYKQHYHDEIGGYCSTSIIMCNLCYINKNPFSFIKNDVGRIPLPLKGIKLNLIEKAILSPRILCKKLVKLENSGMGLKGTAINVRTSIASDLKVKVPRKDAVKYICATIIGDKNGGLEHQAYLKSKELNGLKADVEKVRLYYSIIPDKYKIEHPDWDEIPVEVDDSTIIVDNSMETKLVNQKVTSDYANAAVQSHQGDKAPEEVFVVEPIAGLSEEESLVPLMAQMMGICTIESTLRPGFKNEINELPEILQETFTTIFVLEKIPNISVQKVCDYLFNFYDTRFQTCNDLIIYLSDVLRRLRNTWHTNYRILGKSAKEHEFVRYTNTPEFADDLKKAVKIYERKKHLDDQLALYKNEKREERSEATSHHIHNMELQLTALKDNVDYNIFTKINSALHRLIHLTQPKIKWSNAEREALMPIFYSFRDEFGSGNFWITLTFQAYTNRLVLKLTLENSANTVKEDVLNYKHCFKDKNALFEQIKTNPIAKVKVFKMLMDAIFCHLLGIDCTSKKTNPYTENEGLWGYARAAVGVIEATGTGALHTHVILWCLVHVMVLRELIASKERLDELITFIDSTVHATFERSVHKQYNQYCAQQKKFTKQKKSIKTKKFNNQQAIDTKEEKLEYEKSKKKLNAKVCESLEIEVKNLHVAKTRLDKQEALVKRSYPKSRFPVSMLQPPSESSPVLNYHLSFVEDLVHLASLHGYDIELALPHQTIHMEVKRLYALYKDYLHHIENSEMHVNPFNDNMDEIFPSHFQPASSRHDHHSHCHSRHGSTKKASVQFVVGHVNPFNDTDDKEDEWDLDMVIDVDESATSAGNESLEKALKKLAEKMDNDLVELNKKYNQGCISTTTTVNFECYQLFRYDHDTTSANAFHCRWI